MEENIVYIDPHEITPLHNVRNPVLRDELAEDMIENGWGRHKPLLVVKRVHDYLAWTGSHRIAAALQAELSSIPCYVLQEEQLTSRGYDAEYGHVDDTDRLKILRKIGDETALNLMWMEGRE